jgi:hypothetical protein
MNKSRRMRRARHLAGMAEMNAYTILVGNAEGKIGIGRPKRRLGILR